jgi:hypothetical protein
MSDLSKEARAILETARCESLPTEGDRIRMQRALSAVLGPLPLPEPHTAASSGAASAAAPLSIAAKLWVTGAVVALVAGGVALWRADGSVEPALRVSPPEATLVGPEPSVPEETAAPSPAPRQVAPVARRETPHIRPSSGTARPGLIFAPMDLTEPAAQGRAEPPEPGRQATRPTLPEELPLLREAQLATRVGNFARALELLEEHAARFPSGDLREERIAARINVLCSLGRIDDAREEAKRFLAQAPETPYASRIRASCAGR